MAPTYKLTYYPISALAEPIRYLLNYGGIDVEDYRFDRKDWPKIKPGMPFGQVPVLEIDGKKTYQSIAISRYLAKKVKLCGVNEWEDMEIDAVVDTINDFRAKIAAYHYETDRDATERLKKPLFAEVIPYYLGRLDAIAKANGGHLVGGKLTWADLYFVALLEYMNFMSGKVLIEGYSNLQKVESNVLSLPSIKAWCEKRPKSDFLPKT
ncbi:hypothetical protein FQA39_LY05494 [Lamprigera yunnana]|nr:hypothetical protein FQA39_LY05494 [Lamprigera yunnana]